MVNGHMRADAASSSCAPFKSIYCERSNWAAAALYVPSVLAGEKAGEPTKIERQTERNVAAVHFRGSEVRCYTTQLLWG
jgi:hypothetical protein